MDHETNVLNVIPYFSSTSDKIGDIYLKRVIDLTIFVQILEFSPLFRHDTVHIVTALKYDISYLISAILVTLHLKVLV